MEVFLYYFLLFMIFSFIGWIIDVTSALIENPKLVNRGFLIGPYCPIYGVGSLIMVSYLTQYKDNIITVFLLSVIICCTLEYLVSYVLEKVFHTRWWDYSKHKFHLNGRICMSNAIIFATASISLIYCFNPLFSYILHSMNPIILNIISIILLIIFLLDCIISCNVIYKFTRNMKNNEKDSTVMLSKKVKKELKILQNRIAKAYPSLKFIGNIKKIVKW